MNAKVRSFLKSFALEVVVYGALVTAYFFLVLHFLGGWLHELFLHERKTYAAMALVLLGAQGLLLDQLTRLLLHFIKPNAEEGKK